jgi:hypothetical protein
LPTALVDIYLCYVIYHLPLLYLIAYWLKLYPIITGQSWENNKILWQ